MGLISEARTRLKTAIQTEFAADQLTVLDDKLNRAIGQDGNYCGISPISEGPGPNAHTLEAVVLVQIHQYFDAQINEYQLVDPASIEGWADRLRDCLRPEALTGTNTCWYFRIDDITYPDDPTGNKTRLEAKIKAFGPNNNVI